VPTTWYPLDAQPVTVQAPLVVGGARGAGRPELTSETVGFNGGGWVEVDGRPQWLSGETFRIDRQFEPEEWDEPDERGWYFECCKTRQQPYDLAVTASLIRLAHRFPEGVEVGSDGGPDEWQPAVDLCREVFGQAELPFPVRESQAAAAEPDRLQELLARRDDGRLAPHEVGELRDLRDRDLDVADQVLGSDTGPAREPDQPECAL